MPTRLEALIAFLVAAIPLQIWHYHILADIFFALCVFLILEAIMCSLFLYSPLSLKIGRAKDARLIKLSFLPMYDVLCIPVSLRFRWWEVKDIRFVIKSLDMTTDSELCDRTGHSLGDDHFTLDWRNTKGWIVIAYLDGGEIAIGTPTWHKFLGRKQNHPVVVEVWHSDKLVTYSNYILGMNLCLSDDSRHNLEGG